MNSSFNMRSFKDVIIQKHKLRFRETIPFEMIRDMRLISFEEELTQNILVDIETYLAKVEKSETTTSTNDEEPVIEISEKAFITPKTWLDHFKLDHFPNWLLRCFPINFVVEKFPVSTTIKKTQIINFTTTTTKLCPHIEMKNDYDCVRFLA